jgi:hypothetical protein
MRKISAIKTSAPMLLAALALGVTPCAIRFAEAQDRTSLCIHQCDSSCYSVPPAYKTGCVESCMGPCKRGGNQQNSGTAVRYGAIAYSPSASVYGYSRSESSVVAAKRKAAEDCGLEDCQVAISFSDCGALAKDEDNGFWGTGFGGNVRLAGAWAQHVCAEKGGRICKLQFAICTQ